MQHTEVCVLCCCGVVSHVSIPTELLLPIPGCDDEERWLDVSTVRGYKRVVMCEEVREEVRAVLGEATDIKEFLLALCDDRLVATPWLNRVSHPTSVASGRDVLDTFVQPQ